MADRGSGSGAGGGAIRPTIPSQDLFEARYKFSKDAERMAAARQEQQRQYAAATERAAAARARLFETGGETSRRHEIKHAVDDMKDTQKGTIADLPPTPRFPRPPPPPPPVNDSARKMRTVSTGTGGSRSRESMGTVSGVSTAISEQQAASIAEAAKREGALEYKARIDEQRAAEAIRRNERLEAELRRATGKTSAGTSMGGAPKSVLAGESVGRMGFVVLGVIFSICVILAFVSLDRYNNGDAERAKTMVLGIIIAIAVSLALGVAYIIYLNASKDEIWWGEMKTKDKLIFSVGIAVLIGILVMAIYIHKDIDDGTKAKDVEGLFIGMSSLCLGGLFGSGYAFGRTDRK